VSRIYNASGGYRKLHSFQFAAIVHLGTISFCKRFIHWKEDPLGKMVGQMIGASRSGKQNIIEGSERAKTSSETEIRLTDVAKASLSELQGDLEDYLVGKGSIPWSVHNPDHKRVLSIMLEPFEYDDDMLHRFWTHLLREKAKFDPWLANGDDLAAANALIVLIQRATGLLGRQLQRLETVFLECGGIKEKMFQARIQARQPVKSPNCPLCGEPMRPRNSSRGEFWGCSHYPACKGTRSLASSSHEVTTSPS